MGRDSSVGIATRYGLDRPGIESRWEARFSAPVQTGPGAYPASCTMGTGSFPGVKRPGRGADHPTPSKCRGHERVGLYLYSPSGPSWSVIGRISCITICVVDFLNHTCIEVLFHFITIPQPLPFAVQVLVGVGVP